MAGHIQDRWYKTEIDANGKPVKAKTDRHGTGLRYRARYVGPDGTEKSKSFRDKELRLAKQWLAHIEADMSRGQAESHRRIIVGTVSAALSAAVDDGLLSKNPCRARTVQLPKAGKPRIVPWTAEQVFGVRAALPQRYQAAVDAGAGCGLRQGEIFGLAIDELDFGGGWLAVGHQLKRIRGKYVFALPKGGKVRDVPLPKAVATVLRAHTEECEPIDVTLPWRTPDGPLVTKRLIFSGAEGDHVRVSHFNDHSWKPALAAAGIIPEAKPGERYASAREHGMHALRHFYASVLLDAGESIRALSQYLGHSDPGFTLRTYTHLMPSSEGRTRKAVDSLYLTSSMHDHGPETAQAA
ncbi:site-specific integrase [Streptomyces cellulosae]